MQSEDMQVKLSQDTHDTGDMQAKLSQDKHDTGDMQAKLWWMGRTQRSWERGLRLMGGAKKELLWKWGKEEKWKAEGRGRQLWTEWGEARRIGRAWEAVLARGKVKWADVRLRWFVEREKEWVEFWGEEVAALLEEVREDVEWWREDLYRRTTGRLVMVDTWYRCEDGRKKCVDLEVFFEDVKEYGWFELKVGKDEKTRKEAVASAEEMGAIGAEEKETREEVLGRWWNETRRGMKLQEKVVRRPMFAGYVVVEGAGEELRWRYRRRRVYNKVWEWKKGTRGCKEKKCDVVWEEEGWRGREEQERVWSKRARGNPKKYKGEEERKKAKKEQDKAREKRRVRVRKMIVKK